MENIDDNPAAKQSRQTHLAEGMTDDVLSGERDRQVNQMRAESGQGPWHVLSEDMVQKPVRHPKIGRFFEIVSTSGTSRVVGPNRRKP